MNDQTFPFHSLKVETRNEFASLKNPDQTHSSQRPMSLDRTNSRPEILTATSATRRLTKQRHFTQSKEVMSPTVYPTRELISMDQCKEMIEIENEFGSCIAEEPLKTEATQESANNYWMHLHQMINHTNSKQFNSFLSTIHNAVIQASSTQEQQRKKILIEFLKKKTTIKTKEFAELSKNEDSARLLNEAKKAAIEKKQRDNNDNLEEIKSLMSSIARNFEQERHYSKQVFLQIGSNKGSSIYKGDQTPKVNSFWSPQSVSHMIEVKKKLKQNHLKQRQRQRNYGFRKSSNHGAPESPGKSSLAIESPVGRKFSLISNEAPMGITSPKNFFPASTFRSAASRYNSAVVVQEIDLGPENNLCKSDLIPFETEKFKQNKKQTECNSKLHKDIILGSTDLTSDPLAFLIEHCLVKVKEVQVTELQRLQRLKDQQQQRKSSSSRVDPDQARCEDVPAKSLNLYMLKQQKTCSALESLVTSLQTKDPNFSQQWLNQFNFDSTISDVLPILSLLLGYFKADAVVQANLSVRQQKRAIMKQLQQKMKLIVGLSSSRSEPRISESESSPKNKRLINLRSSGKNSLKKEQLKNLYEVEDVPRPSFANLPRRVLINCNQRRF